MSEQKDADQGPEAEGDQSQQPGDPSALQGQSAAPATAETQPAEGAESATATADSNASHTSTGNTTEAKVLREQGRITGKLAFSLFVIAMGSSFQFGYNIGSINAPDVLIKEWIVENHNDTHHTELSEDTLDHIWSAAVSLFPLGAMIGALASGYLADKFGRKTSLHANNALAFLCAILMTLAKYVGFYPLLHIGRFVIGISSSVVPMYVTELSPIRYRGAIGSLPQLVVTVSILVAQLMGLPFIFGTDERWPFIFTMIAVPAVFQVIGLFFVPESPKYLLCMRDEEDKSQAALMALRDDEKLVTAEIAFMRTEQHKMESNAKISVVNLLFQRGFRWPLFLAAFLMVAQQLSGINAAMFYSTEIFRSAGIPHDNAVYATIGVGAVNVLTTILSVWMVDSPHFGRRSLLLIGMIGMIFASLALVVSIYCFRHDIGKSVTPFMACAFLPLFVFFFATGPGSIPFFYVSEVFPSNARASASAICVAVNWTFTVIVGQLFLPIERVLHEFTFLIFTVACAIAATVIMMFLPETKGKSLEEVEEELNKKKARCCC